MARTHALYFSEDTLAPIRAAVDELDADWQGRAGHVPAGIAKAGELRLTALRTALDLLAEPVSEALY